MSTPKNYRGLINVRLRCTRDPRLTAETYGLTDEQVAERVDFDLDSVGEISGVTVHDCTEWEASREGGDPAGRLVLFCQVEIEADTEEEAIDALDEACAYAPGYAVEEWSTVPAEIDAD